MSTSASRLSGAILACLMCVLLAAGVAQQRSSRAVNDSAKKTISPHGPLAISCQNCHTFSGWKPIRNVPEFDHSKTRYPLRGMHQNVACTQCHTKPVFTDIGKKCADCHADIHRRQMGANCEHCHSVQGWAASIKTVRDHQNRFPLIGAHAVTECESCHKGAAVGQYKGLSTDCAGCHIARYMTVTSPNHRVLGFPTTCQQCHTSFDTWRGAKFDHSLTGFPLTGAHANLDCVSCHVGGKYQGTSANCISCHLNDFNSAKNPDHVASGFPRTCQQCHSTLTWAGAKFDHATFTGFALTGAHASLQCTQCHVNGRFDGTPTNCASCHMNDFNKTTNPNHVSAGFPTDCSVCHSTSTWAGAKFDHSKTKFPLTGAHLNQACSSCHANGKYSGLSTACSSCHLTNYNNTKNPNHVAAGFPQTCEVCHSTSAWTPANFNHNQTRFPLTGAHVNVQCSNCHIGGKYAGTPTDCYSCHRADYTGVANPNHVAAGFPTTCTTCHNTTRWSGATFNHTWFPIYSGAHAGKWSTCADCHQNASNFAVFTCTSCHEHDKLRMDEKHREVRNYVYNSANCYSCHPLGRSN